MRLTKKDIAYITSGANVIQAPDMIEGHKYTGQAIIKLGQLEDIEEELGIDLITLFKALKNGVYCELWSLDKGRYIDFDSQVMLAIDYQKQRFILTNILHCFNIKDYGKTWALTKEELL